MLYVNPSTSAPPHSTGGCGVAPSPPTSPASPSSRQVANYITETATPLPAPKTTSSSALYIGLQHRQLAPERGCRHPAQSLRDHLQPGDALLLGTDLAPGERKSVATLRTAYDDAAGVTAAFNKNVLVRLNRELDANFDLDAFAHRARWNAVESRIEMHLESLTAQTVRVAGEDIVFAKGETIHTENSYKFTSEGLAALLAGAGFSIDHIMHDPDHRFAVTLAEAV